MNHAALNSIMQQVKTLTQDEQRALNKLLVANIRHAQKSTAIMTSASLEIGEVVKFDAKTRGMIYIKVTGFSRDMSKVKGIQINRGMGSSRAGMNWQATATLVKPATKEEVARVTAA